MASTSIYEIEGNLITRVTRTIETIGRLSDMLPSLTTYRPIEVGNLPRDCSYIKVEPAEDGRVRALVIVTQPPQTRRILFNESGGAVRTQRAYDLAIPYHIFWMRMSGSPQGTTPESMLWAPRHWATMWSRQPPRNVHNDTAIHPYMPNTWTDGRVCFGNNPIDANQSLGQYIDGLVNTYWTSVFNTDLGVRTPYGTQARAGLARWEQETTADPACWRNWDIWTNEVPVLDFISNIGDDNWTEPMPDSVEPVIPQTPRIWTFYSIQNWLSVELDEAQRQRLLWALQNDTVREVEGASALDHETLPTRSPDYD